MTHPNPHEIARAALQHFATGQPIADAALRTQIEKAARLAAGGDLVDGQSAATLRSVFDHIEIHGAKAISTHTLPISALHLGEALFPDGKADKAVSVADLREKLTKAAADLAHQPAAVAIESLLGALQRYGWRIPAAGYGSHTDISLYDQAQVTAAIAAALPPEQPAEVLLLGGDISGIQDFIYTISAKNAAKSLRGRSFYLQILTEAVLRYVLRQLDLPYSSVLYSGGGHFFLIAPTSAIDQLSAIRQQVTERLLHHHGTALYLALGWATVRESDFTDSEALSTCWGAMHNHLALSKRQRYAELGDAMHAHVFGLQGDPNNTCAVCGDDRRSPIAGGSTNEDDPNERFEICPLCKSFEALGADLTQSDYLALGHLAKPNFNPSYAPTDYAATLASFGITLTMRLKGGEAFNPTGDLTHATLWSLGDPDKWPTAGRTPASQLVRYVVNRVPPMTFDKLQQKVTSGFQRLGVLRMDVDHLGQIFRDGLRSAYTLTRVASLSAAMSLFFEGHIKHLLREYNDVYAVYAGGDDLFLIGPWTIMPELAIKITDDFKRYTGGHPGLHISGGLAFIGGKYPVYQAAADAEQAEKQAKNAGRNRFSFLDVPWTWKEFRELRDDHQLLVNLVKDAPTAVLQTLQTLATQQATSAQNGKPEWGPWQWRGAYQFTRMIEKEKNNEIKQGYETVYNRLKDDFKTIPYWGKAARWAQLEVRKSRE